MRIPQLHIEQASPDNNDREFFKNSFKQLSDVQQKQVGLLVGGCVADFYAGKVLAKVKSLDVDKLMGEKEAMGEPTVLERLASEEEAAAEPLQSHSYSLEMQSQLVHTMGSGTMTFSLDDDVRPRWVAVAAALPRSHALHHGSLLHVANVLSVLPAVYPWSCDEDLRAFAGPYVSFMTDPTPLLLQEQLSSSAAKPLEMDELIREECAATGECVESILGVFQRLLQSNPDAVRNGAFKARPNTGLVFPSDVAMFVQQQQHDLSDRRRCEWGKLESAANLRLFREAVYLSQAMEVSRLATSYREGIDAVLRVPAAAPLSTVVSQRLRLTSPVPSARVRRAQAMFVGAALGARFGVRSVPTEWFGATVDHALVAGFAISVAQMAWNPIK